MYVLHAWKSSVQLFKPSNLKLFLLVTLKSIMSTYKNYFKYGWPLIVAAAGATWYAYHIEFEVPSKMAAVMLHQQAIIEKNNALAQGAVSHLEKLGFLLMLLGFFAFVSRFLVAIYARPSVDKKDCAYMRRYFKRYFLQYIVFDVMFVGISILIVLVPIFLVRFLHHNDVLISLASTVDMNFIACVVNGIFVTFHFFSLFFLLDLERSIISPFKALWLGLKMMFYNIPFVIIISALLALWCYITSVYSLYGNFLNILLYPVIFCFIGNYYTKKVHDQARLYQGN